MYTLSPRSNLPMPGAEEASGKRSPPASTTIDPTSRHESSTVSRIGRASAVVREPTLSISSLAFRACGEAMPCRRFWFVVSLHELGGVVVHDGGAVVGRRSAQVCVGATFTV